MRHSSKPLLHCSLQLSEAQAEPPERLTPPQKNTHVFSTQADTRQNPQQSQLTCARWVGPRASQGAQRCQPQQGWLVS